MANPTGNIRIKGGSAGDIVLGNSWSGYTALKLKSFELERTSEGPLELKGADAQTKLRAWWDLGHKVTFTAYASSSTALPDPGDDLVIPLGGGNASLTFDVESGAKFQGEENGPKLLVVSGSRKDGMSA
ncbi:MAG: hypothetical protein NT105_23700 [Verrucomicrobia bacterium]|nr:hypothetical protein [Verrucomicrobiota bacterium]